MPRRKQQAPKRAAGKRWLRSGCPAPEPGAQRLARPSGPGLVGTPPPGAFKRVSLRVPSSSPLPDLPQSSPHQAPSGWWQGSCPTKPSSLKLFLPPPSTPPLTFSSSLAFCLWSQSCIVDLGCREGRDPPHPSERSVLAASGLQGQSLPSLWLRACKCEACPRPGLQAGFGGREPRGCSFGRQGAKDTPGNE